MRDIEHATFQKSMPRSHHNQIDVPVTPDEAFEALVTPSAIRAWWSASRAIVIPEEGGLWMAAWGDDEDNPEYISGATISIYEPPHRLALSSTKYVAQTGPLPFEADLPFEFSIEANGSGCTIHVHHTGFPDDPIADAHYRGCEIGWEQTLASLKAFLSNS